MELLAGHGFEGGGHLPVGHGLADGIALNPLITNVNDVPVITLNDGAFTVEIELGPYAGTYTQDVSSIALTVANVEAGPMALLAPDVAGDTAEGDTLTAFPALWIYTGTIAAPTYKWQRDGVDIPGATGATYTIVAADAGTDLNAVETFGGVSVESATITADAVATFAPSDIASLADDFDADATPTTLTTSGSDVTLWENSEAGGNDLTILNAAFAPSTGAVTQNGLETVSFDGTEYLVDATAVDFSASGTLMIVFRANSATNGAQSIYSSTGGAGATFQIDTNATTDGEFHGRVNTTAHTNLERGVSSGNDWIILAYRWNFTTNTADLWTNGVMDDDVTDYNTAYPATPARIAMPSNRNANQHLNSDIGQCWRFNAALSDTDLAQMFTYASTRWGIALDT